MKSMSLGVKSFSNERGHVLIIKYELFRAETTSISSDRFFLSDKVKQKF